MKITEETNCRVCGGELKVVLDLGEIVPSGFTQEKVISEKAPLVLAECEECKLVQLKHTVDLDQMYRQYWYASSLNKSMVSSLQDIVTEIEDRIQINPYDYLLDIGCNDGTLLSLYKQESIYKVGFDPALNLKKPEIDVFINDYFSYDKWSYTLLPTKFAKVVTAIAMFYDLPDPHQFVQDVADILHEDGIFVVQFTDLLSMYKATAFDNICHEHLEYYKLVDVKMLLEAHGLEVIDASYNDVNGGSLRVVAAHAGRYPVSKDVQKKLNHEDRYMELYGLRYFKERIEHVKTQIYNFLTLAKQLKVRVFLLGASTKGNTLLQVCNVTGDLVPYAAEVNPEKFGLYTAGTNIEIISEDEALEMNPEFFFVPIWHFKQNILSNTKIKKYLEEGGRVVFPLPLFEFADKDGLHDKW
jgi:SAM-dependent methyltransferase